MFSAVNGQCSETASALVKTSSSLHQENGTNDGSPPPTLSNASHQMTVNPNPEPGPTPQRSTRSLAEIGRHG